MRVNANISKMSFEDKLCKVLEHNSTEFYYITNYNILRVFVLISYLSIGPGHSYATQPKMRAVLKMNHSDWSTEMEVKVSNRTRA